MPDSQHLISTLDEDHAIVLDDVVNSVQGSPSLDIRAMF